MSCSMQASLLFNLGETHPFSCFSPCTALVYTTTAWYVDYGNCDVFGLVRYGSLAIQVFSRCRVQAMQTRQVGDRESGKEAQLIIDW